MQRHPSGRKPIVSLRLREPIAQRANRPYAYEDRGDDADNGGGVSRYFIAGRRDQRQTRANEAKRGHR